VRTRLSFFAGLGAGAGRLELGAFQAQAAEPSARQATDPGRSYVVAPGDTLDRIIHKTMAQSPLKIELLREALAAANPQAIASVRNPRLRAGAVLQLPDHEALLRTAVLPLLQPAVMASHPTPVDADNRKRWVRYP
jgi:Tfp pilus assembly protein FimV